MHNCGCAAIEQTVLICYVYTISMDYNRRKGMKNCTWCQGCGDSYLFTFYAVCSVSSHFQAVVNLDDETLRQAKTRMFQLERVWQSSYWWKHLKLRYLWWGWTHRASVGLCTKPEGKPHFRECTNACLQDWVVTQHSCTLKQKVSKSQMVKKRKKEREKLFAEVET